jgi:hypothetical protein
MEILSGYAVYLITNGNMIADGLSPTIKLNDKQERGITAWGKVQSSEIPILNFAQFYYFSSTT